MFQTTIQSGFARSRSEALFPRLFPDAGWWCPSLQSPGGTRLHDLRGSNWGTLTSMDNTDWVVSGGRGALDFDGSNDRVRCGLIREFPGNSFTASAWIRALPSPPAANGNMVLSNLNAQLSQGLHFINLTSSGQLNVAAATGGSVTGITIGPDLRDSTWHHVCTGRNGAITGTNGFVYLDGKLLGTGNFGTLQIPSNEQLQIGQRADNGFNQVFFGQIDDIRLYSRPLASGDARQLWQLGRGNMPMARKRRYTEEAAAGFKAYWARRQSQLIGGGL